MKNHLLDCYTNHTHEYPMCCSFQCWCVKELPKGFCRLEDIEPGETFIGPDGKTYPLMFITPSAAWVRVTEDIEFEKKDKKTGEIKVIKTKKTENQPWSRGTVVQFSQTIQENIQELIVDKKSPEQSDSIGENLKHEN